MNPYIGLALAIAALLIGWFGFGWQGLLVAVTVLVFWLLLQLNRIMRVMRRAAEAPIGKVPSAVMLNAKLHAGMPLLEVIKLTHSIGRMVAKDPETFEWTDPGGASVRVELERGFCTRWTLIRPHAPDDAA